MRFTYFLLLIISALFYVLYKGDLSFILFAFMAALPFMLFISIAVCASRLKVSVYCDDPSAERGKPAVIKVRLHNRTFLPISSCNILVSYKVSAPFESGDIQKYNAVIPLSAFDEETVSLSFTPEHCGTLDIYVRKIILHDLLEVTSMRRKIGFHKKITVLPRLFPINADIESNLVFSAESNTFSQDKPGDDPSEIFRLREYRDGDRHNRIHWKLSSRSENFIVKELSHPVGSKILLMTDFSGCKSAEDTDRILEAAAAVSNYLAENGTSHFWAVPYDGCNLYTAEITGTEGFYSEINKISSTSQKFELNSSTAYTIEIADSAFILNGEFSRVIVFSERSERAFSEELLNLCKEARLTIICTDISGADSEKSDENLSEAEIIYADAEKLSSDIKGFTI